MKASDLTEQLRRKSVDTNAMEIAFQPQGTKVQGTYASAVTRIPTHYGVHSPQLGSQSQGRGASTCLHTRLGIAHDPASFPKRGEP